MKPRLAQARAPERLAALFAFAILLYVIVLPSQPRTWLDAFGDYKLVYASASALVHQGAPYSHTAMSEVFREQGVVGPRDWFAHNPVYPFFTLLTVAPTLLLPMIPAAYVWGCLDYLVVALAAVRLARYAERRYALGLAWRLVLIALVAASPLVSFALEVANLSVATACLCLFAITEEPDESVWLHAGALTLALLLKPHLAFWVVLALFLLRRPRERGIAWRAAALFAAVALVMTGCLLVRHQLLPVMSSYRDMLHVEAAPGGSMDVHAHEDFLGPAQITAFGLLLGYWIEPLGQIARLDWAVLVPLGLVLLWASLRAPLSRKPLVVSAWVVYGFLVTYHRAHDGIVLFTLLPWAMAALRRRWFSFGVWAMLLPYLLFSLDIPHEWWLSVAGVASLRPLGLLLADRQVALATPFFFLVLLLLVLAPRLRNQDLADDQARKPTSAGG